MTAPTTTSSSSSPQPKSWIALINESVHTSDDIDIGDIDAISRDFIVVKRGFVNVHHYYIPISKVEGWDGNVLWLKVAESEIKANYERDKTPDPLQYYVKDYAYYSSLHYPELTTIPLRYTRPTFTVPSPPSSEVPRIYKCGLCDTSFNTEDELSKHVTSQH
jgi:hypothetical protein